MSAFKLSVTPLLSVLYFDTADRMQIRDSIRFILWPLEKEEGELVSEKS